MSAGSHQKVNAVRTKSQQTVLIVEDVEWIRHSMRQSFRRLGYHVVEASNAAEAALSADADPPDVIVTDEELPTLGELLDGVRGSGPLRGVPVTIINPDEEEGARVGELLVLADNRAVQSLLNGTRE
jgi:two-component system, chemotaxis family, chemotaxis protein CheY